VSFRVVVCLRLGAAWTRELYRATDRGDAIWIGSSQNFFLLLMFIMEIRITMSHHSKITPQREKARGNWNEYGFWFGG